MKISIEQLKDRISRGMSDAEIAAEFHMHEVGVRMRRSRNQLQGVRSKLPGGRKRRIADEDVINRLNLGWSDCRMAEDLGVSVSCVQKRRCALGFRTAYEGRRTPSLSRDEDMARLAAEGLSAREIGKRLSGRSRPLSPSTITLRCRKLGIKLARSPLDEDVDPPAVTRARLAAADEKMAAAMAGHIHESLQIKSHGTPKFPRPITHCETASSAALAVA